MWWQIGIIFWILFAAIVKNFRCTSVLEGNESLGFDKFAHLSELFVTGLNKFLGGYRR